MYDNHARRSVIVLRVIPELESMSLPNEICLLRYSDNANF